MQDVSWKQDTFGGNTFFILKMIWKFEMEIRHPTLHGILQLPDPLKVSPSPNKNFAQPPLKVREYVLYGA